MTDVHSHILFNIDDGSDSIEESITLLKELKSIGFTDIILTPHYIKGSEYSANNQTKIERFSELKEEICPVQFKVLKSKNSEIQIEVKYLDLEGKEASKRQSYNLSGEEIHFDFTVIKLNEKNYLFFPKTLYTNTIAPESGTNLTAHYSEKAYPVIYNKLEKFVKADDSKNLKLYKEEISHLFSLVESENVDMINDKFGNAVHNMNGITEFKKGYSYKIICHPHTGSIEIQKM